MIDYKELDGAVSVLSSYIDSGNTHSQDKELRDAIAVVRHAVGEIAEAADRAIVAFSQIGAGIEEAAEAIRAMLLPSPGKRNGYDPFDARSMWAKPKRNDFVYKRPLINSHARYKVRRVGFRRANC